MKGGKISEREKRKKTNKKLESKWNTCRIERKKTSIQKEKEIKYRYRDEILQWKKEDPMRTKNRVTEKEEWNEEK